MAQGEIADLGFKPWPAYDEEPATFTDLIVRKLQNVYRQSQKRLTQMMPASTSQPGRLCVRSAPRVRGNQPGPAGERFRGYAGAGPASRSQDRPPAGGSRGRGAPLRPAGGCRRLAPSIACGSELEPSVCDLYDWRLLSLARDADPAVPCLDRRGGRVGSHRRIRERPARGGRGQGAPAHRTDEARADFSRPIR